MNQRVVLKTDRDIHVLELCTPPANQTDQLFFQELAEAIHTISESSRCTGVVVCGRGRHFSSGADIEELITNMGDDDTQGMEESRFRSLSTFDGLARLPFPVVAAIQGCCLGSGLELALACHFRIATKNTIFSMPEMEYGLMPGCGGTYRLPRIVGVGKSIEMILSGRNLLAGDALKIHLIDHVVEKNNLMESAAGIIRRVGVSTS